jgi:NitT/TauT family transport system permease protein
MSDTVLRPEILQSPCGAQDFGIVEKKLTPFERLYNQVWLRKVVLIVLLALGWEI